jgi:carboxypeptidase family protein
MKPSRILPKVSHARINVRTFLNALSGTIVMLALAFMVAASTQAQTPQQINEVPAQSTSTKGSLVRGRVIYEDTRRPLRRVQVSAYDPASRGLGRHLMAWTNARGEFQFKEVPAGKYFVAVEAPGIIRARGFESEEAQADLTTVTVDGTGQAEVRGENAYMLRGDQFALRAAKGQRVTLQPGENSRIDLTVPSEK